MWMLNLTEPDSCHGSPRLLLHAKLPRECWLAHRSGKENPTSTAFRRKQFTWVRDSDVARVLERLIVPTSRPRSTGKTQRLLSPTSSSGCTIQHTSLPGAEPHHFRCSRPSSYLALGTMTSEHSSLLFHLTLLRTWSHSQSPSTPITDACVDCLLVPLSVPQQSPLLSLVS